MKLNVSLLVSSLCFTKMSEFGTEFLPMEWENLKSWKNGKKVYYRK